MIYKYPGSLHVMALPTACVRTPEGADLLAHKRQEWLTEEDVFFKPALRPKSLCPSTVKKPILK